MYRRVLIPLLASALTALTLALPAPASAAIGCSPESRLFESETYGVMAVFGARCDHSLNVTAEGRLFRNGTLVGKNSVTCRNTSQGQVCDDFTFANNPKGQQTFKLRVTIWWDFAEDPNDGPYKQVHQETRTF